MSAGLFKSPDILSDDPKKLYMNTASMPVYFQYRNVHFWHYRPSTSPCIFLYVHKMSHTKPVPGPVSLQAEAGPGPVMPMPMLPIALTMLPMRRQWVKPCNHRRKLGPPLWTEFSKSMFQPSNFISAPKSEYPYSFISECTVIGSPSVLKALFRGMISCKLLHNPTRPYSNTFPTAFSTSFVSRFTDLLLA